MAIACTWFTGYHRWQYLSTQGINDPQHGFEALEAQWVIGYRHRREIYLVVDGDYYPWGTADSTLRLTLLGRQFAPTRLGLLLFICLLPVSLLFYRYLLWGIFFEVGLPSSQRVRLLCGYDAWCRALQRKRSALPPSVLAV